MLSDFRDWIASLEANSLLTRHREVVDARNCSAVVFNNYASATYFEHVDGYEYPVVANTVSSRRMIALSLETDVNGILSEYLSRISKPIKPRFRDNADGRCQENVVAYEESKVDLTSFPILLQHEFDGAPYVTAGVLIAKDPETSEYNIGIYRLMFRSKNELGINITAPHKLRWFYQKAFQKKQALEVAVCLGLHALDLLAAVTSAPEGVDELALWGGLQKSAIEMVKCKTIDLYVPEHAEIILEGHMDPVGWVEPEGMYGEFPGTYSGMRKNPFVKIQAITTRKNAIYQSATHGGKHLAYTDFTVIIPQIELSIYQALKIAGIEARQVRIVEGSAGMICYVSIQARAIGESANAIHVALAGSRQNFPKYCAIFDADIDVFDDEAVTWALSTRVQPKDDALIFDGLRIPSSSDPSLPSDVRTMSKLGIDATVPFNSDSSRFKHSRPPTFQEYRVEKNGNESSGNVDRKITELLRTKQPLFFYDVARELAGNSFRDILSAWSTLRSKRIIELGMDGRYSLKTKDA